MVVVGLTVKVLPLPSKVPPQDPLYQLYCAPVPNVPPTADKLVVLPEQMVVAVAVALVGAVDNVLTLTVMLAQAVVLQVPSARTK